MASTRIVHDRLKELLRFSEGDYLDYKRIFELEQAAEDFLRCATGDYSLEHYKKARDFVMEYINSYDRARFTKTSTESRLSFYSEWDKEGVCGVQIALLTSQIHVRHIVRIDGVLTTKPQGIIGV